MLFAELQHTQSLAIFINNRNLWQKDMRSFKGEKERGEEEGVPYLSRRK
jgi:hypothetical protein